MSEETLDRIATALESIAESLKAAPKTGSGKKERRKKTDNSPVTQITNLLIATYIESWQKRYGTSARPDMSGKAQGILKRLAEFWMPDVANNLLQTYCQMDDPWFVTKRHDLPTFEANLNKVSLALDKGHENTAINFGKVFQDGQELLSPTNGQDDKNLGGAVLPSGEARNVLAGLPERF